MSTNFSCKGKDELHTKPWTAFTKLATITLPGFVFGVIKTLCPCTKLIQWEKEPHNPVKPTEVGELLPVEVDVCTHVPMKQAD